MDCDTVYPNRESMSRESLIALGYFNILVTICNVVLNVFLCYALWKTGQLYKLSSKFIFCLSVSDTFVALTTQSLVSYLLLSESKAQNCKIEAASHFFSFTLNQFSGDMIMIVALDRFFHMKYLNKYSAYMNNTRGIMLVALNVAISLFGGITAMLVAILDGFFIWHSTFVILDTLVIITTMVLYIRMYLNVKKIVDSLNLRSNITPVENGVKKPKPRQYNFTLAKTMSFVLVSMVCAYIPYFCVGSASIYYYHAKNQEPSNGLKIAVYFAIIVVYMNCSFSAIIFISFNKSIKKLMAKALGANVSNFNSNTSES